MSDFQHHNALPPGTRVSDIEFKKVLDSGGFGITYYGWEHGLDRPVAVKEYMPSDMAFRSSEMSVLPKTTKVEDDFEWGLERFLEEGKLLAKFDHPNIVKVYRFFKAHGTAYIVMEFLEGPKLSDWLKSDKVSPESLNDVLRDLITGLKLVHSQDCLHRDIKPGNIMMRSDGTPVLIDFGSARYAIGTKSMSLTAIVSPGYAPIEQYSTNGKQGPWTDIYALGAIAYRAITGAKPEQAPDRVSKDPHSALLSLPAEQTNGYSQGFLRAVDWALACYADDRPQTLEAWENTIDGTKESSQSKYSKTAPTTNTAPKLISNIPNHPPAPKLKSNISKKVVVLAVVALFVVGGFGGLWINSIAIVTPDGQIRTGIEAVTGRIVDTTNETKAWEQAEEEDTVAGLKVFIDKFPESKNLSLAQVLIASHYVGGSGGITKDEKAALNWFQKAVKHDHPDALYAKGIYFLEGRAGVTIDLEEARIWLTKAAAEGHPRAHFFVAQNFYNGTAGLQKNLEKAFEWYSRGAVLKDPYCEYMVGTFFEFGIGEQGRNLSEAFKWYRLAADQGDVDAEYKIGLAYEEGQGEFPKNDIEAFKWYRKAADQNEVKAQFKVGHFHYKGLGGLQKNDVEAFKWYSRAAAQQNPDAIYNVGLFHDKGIGGVRQSDFEALKWYQKSANQGHVFAEFALGIYFENGRGGLRKDNVEALKWYRKSANQGYANAELNLGFFYNKGLGGLQKNDVEAFKWYSRAAAQQNPVAIYNVGLFHEKGLAGMAVDIDMAISWYKLSAEQNNSLANSALNRLGVTP